MVALDPAVFLKRYPKQLSGGQQQRVGVARALAADPPVMLMDEPFGAIDPINREVIQDEFLKLQKTLRKTVMFVSHDIDEAVKMADKVAIFRAGKLEQYDSPDNILAHPANPFIAGFVGADRTLKRLRLIKCGQAVSPGTPSVTADDPLARAAALMGEHELPALVVLDGEGRPVGMIAREVASARRGLVGEFSSRLPSTVRADADLRAAVSEMFTHNQTWLAVVDEAGAFKGCLTQAGITHLLGRTYHAAVTAPAGPGRGPDA
jgi:osmoprotectant transport system ATP-binding protein